MGSPYWHERHTAAIETLVRLGYVWRGGEVWVPKIERGPRWLWWRKLRLRLIGRCQA